MSTDNNNTRACSVSCNTENRSSTLACKLTTPELKHRKATVIAGLKSSMMAREELADGYAFSFPGSDQMLDELIEFIKTERTCCDFFIFHLSIRDDQHEARLEMTGPPGAKDFILTELH